MTPALEKVDEAKVMIRNLGQVRLEERLNIIKTEIQDNYLEWKNILSANSSLPDKIEKSMIADYVAETIRVRNEYNYFPS